MSGIPHKRDFAERRIHFNQQRGQFYSLGIYSFNPLSMGSRIR